MRSNRLLGVLTAFAAVLFVTTQLMASLDRGAIRGTVTDPQGAVVPGAKVVVRNVDTSVATNLVTNSAGFYLATELVPGRYTVRVEAQGFSPLEIKDLVVGAGTTMTADAELKVGATAQSVEVSAQAQLVETTSSNFSTGVSRRYLDNLPLEGRDIQTLVSLFPGVIQSAGPSGAVYGFNSQYGGFPDPLHLVGSAISANGGQAGANAWLLDGASNATVGAEAATVNPSPDAVAEFNFVDNGLAAEYGRTSGAVINVVLKSGTNDLHGTLFANNRNSVFSATNPYARRDTNGEPLLSPHSNANDFGGTIGGPVYIPHLYNGKNRTFFFASHDVSLLHVNQNKILTVPLPSHRQGDFTDDPRYAQTCDPANGVTNCLYDPFSTTGPDAEGNYHRTPFLHPVVDPSKIDPLAKFYLDSIPNPNFLDPLEQGPGRCGNLCNNYIGPVGSSMTTHRFQVKIDHLISEKHRLFAEYFWNPSYYTNFRFPWNGPTAQTNTGLAGAQPYNTLNQLGVFGLTSTFTPTLVNELRVSYGRQNLVSRPNLESVTHNKEVEERVKGLNFYLYEPFQPVPNISFYDGDYGLSFGPIQYQNNSQGQQAYTFNDNLTKVWGRHTVKGGITFRRNNLWGNTATGYNLNFYGSYTSDPVTGAGGNGLAEFLMGASGGAGSAVQYAPWQTNDDYAAFAQDEFRVTKNFTLSYGLRWDVYGWIRERHDMLANFDLAAMNPDIALKGRLVYMGTPAHPDRNLFPAIKDSLGPRLGFAWSPFGNSKTVIRGGYGLIYSNSVSAAFGQGQGAISSPGSYLEVSTPVQDPTFMRPEFILSQGAPSMVLPDLSLSRKNDVQYVGVYTHIWGYEKPKTDPYVQQWSLFIQRQLPGNMIVSAGYVGSHGTHLLGEEGRNIDQVHTKTLLQLRRNINNTQVTNQAIKPWLDQGNSLFDCFVDTDGLAKCSGWYALAPYPQYYTVQPLLSPDGFNKYHSAQFRVEKRYSHGLNFIAAYTISKNIVSAGLGALVANTTGPTTISNKGVGRIGWIPGAAGGGVADGSRHVYTDDYDNRRRYDALAPDDTPQVLNFAFTYELPFGKGKAYASRGGWSNTVLGGWKLTQNWNFQSGVPQYIPWYWYNDLYEYLPNLVGNPAAGRASKTKAQQADQWYNPNAFCAPFGCSDVVAQAMWDGVWPSPGPNGETGAVDYNAFDPWWTYGNAGLRVPSSRIPGYWNADMSLGKDFRITESKYFTFHWDVFNALNHMNLGVPNNTWCLPPRESDGGLDYIHVFGCQFGRITNIQTDPRSMQFSLRFVW